VRFHYYPETDTLYIDLLDRPGADSRAVAPGVVLDFDRDGHLAGIGIDNASRVAGLSRADAESLPAPALSPEPA
jgi:uncharacterized protein YuzE